MWSSKSLPKIAVGLLALGLLAPFKVVAFDVPITLQTLVLFTLAFWLSWRETFVVVGLYLLLGALGLPIYAGHQSGWEKLIGPTAGFLWGFWLVTTLLSWQVQLNKPNYFMAVVWVFIAHALLLIPGFLVLQWRMEGVELYPTFVRLIPGLLVKSLLGGLLGVFILRQAA